MLEPDLVEIKVIGYRMTLRIKYGAGTRLLIGGRCLEGFYLIVNLCLPLFLLLLLLLLDGFDDLLHLRILGCVHCRRDTGPLARSGTVFNAELWIRVRIQHFKWIRIRIRIQSGSRVLTTKNWRKNQLNFFDQKLQFTTVPIPRMSKLQEKPKALKREYPVLQKWSLLTFLWVIFVLLNMDLDPACESGYGSRSTSLDQCLIIQMSSSIFSGIRIPILRLPWKTFEFKEMLPDIQRKNPLQNKKFLLFCFLFIFFALLDPDIESQSGSEWPKH